VRRNPHQRAEIDLINDKQRIAADARASVSRIRGGNGSAARRYQRASRSTIFRTGRLLTPSMPVISSAFPALPPQPS
jgi:hypothetical protein